MEKRRMRKWAAVLLAVASVMGLTACGQSATGEANTIYGTVTAIDGSNITLALGTLNAEMPQGTPPADGQAPQGGAPADGQALQGTPPADGQAPQGTPPADGQGQRPQGMLTSTGEEKTITVTDESVITVQDGSGKTGLAAISAGSTLKVVYDAADSAKITSIEVLGGGAMPQGTSGTTDAGNTNGTSGKSGTGGTTASPDA